MMDVPFDFRHEQMVICYGYSGSSFFSASGSGALFEERLDWLPNSYFSSWGHFCVKSQISTCNRYNVHKISIGHLVSLLILTP
jgi:hypothetical protein